MFNHLKNLFVRKKPDFMQKILAEAHEIGATAALYGLEIAPQINALRQRIDRWLAETHGAAESRLRLARARETEARDQYVNRGALFTPVKAAWASACAASHERDAAQDTAIVKATLPVAVLLAISLGIGLDATPAVWLSLMALAIALPLAMPALLFTVRATAAGVAAIAIAFRYIWVGLAWADAKRVRARCELKFAEYDHLRSRLAAEAEAAFYQGYALGEAGRQALHDLGPTPPTIPAHQKETTNA